MKKKSLLFISGIIFLGLTMTVLLAGVVFAKQKPTKTQETIELKHSDIHPETYPYIQIVKDYMKEIEEKTAGRVKFTMYAGGILTSAAEIYQGVVEGVSDTGMSVFAYGPGRFPVMEVCDLPGYPSPDGRLTSHVAWDIYKKFNPAELNDVHILFLHNFCPGIISTKDKPIRTLADIKGLRLRCTGTSAPIVKALGAVPVTIPITECYTLIEKGTVDGTLTDFASLTDLKFHEVCKYSVYAPIIGYTAAFFMAMNLEKWNSLPKDIQEVFNKVSPKYVEISGAKWLVMDRKAYEEIKKSGHTFTSFSTEDNANLVQLVVKPIQDKYRSDKKAKGLPADQCLSYRHEREQYWLKKLGMVEYE